MAAILLGFENKANLFLRTLALDGFLLLLGKDAEHEAFLLEGYLEVVEVVAPGVEEVGDDGFFIAFAAIVLDVEASAGEEVGGGETIDSLDDPVVAFLEKRVLGEVATTQGRECLGHVIEVAVTLVVVLRHRACVKAILHLCYDGVVEFLAFLVAE